MKYSFPNLALDARRLRAVGMALTWKRLNKAEQEQLEATSDVGEVKRLISKFCKCSANADAEQTECLVDLYFYALAFCRERCFSPEKTSTLISILYVVLKRDRADGVTTMELSFDRFSKLVVSHSVDRVPKSKEVFALEDVAPIVDYVTNNYYRHFRLYQFVLSARPSMQLVQCSDNLVDQPFTTRKLKDALPENVSAPGLPAASSQSQASIEEE